MNEDLPDCPFCRPDGFPFENDMAYAHQDKYPANPAHLLIIPKCHLLEQAKKLGIHGGSAFKTISGSGRPNILNHTIDTNPHLMQDEHEELFYSLDRTTTHHANFH